MPIIAYLAFGVVFQLVMFGNSAPFDLLAVFHILFWFWILLWWVFCWAIWWSLLVIIGAVTIWACFSLADTIRRW